MKHISRSALVNYSAGQMYQLANDVLSYPQFLPGCVSSRILELTEDTMTASIDVSKVGIRKTFTTRNKMVKDKVIDMKLVDGPFKTLDGVWTFKALRDDACKIELDLHYEFSSRVLEQIIGPVFGMIANSMVDSFCKRAETVYG